MTGIRSYLLRGAKRGEVVAGSSRHIGSNVFRSKGDRCKDYNPQSVIEEREMLSYSSSDGRTALQSGGLCGHLGGKAISSGGYAMGPDCASGEGCAEGCDVSSLMGLIVASMYEITFPCCGLKRELSSAAVLHSMCGGRDVKVEFQ
ncbi:hypothetical protein Tco_1370034 [Tanacetum coccineum]